MASKFQSRLVGTVILVAVGVIVLPDVFDGEKKHYKEELAVIPIKPNIETEMESFEVLEPLQVEAALPESPVRTVTITEPVTAEQEQQAPEEGTDLDRVEVTVQQHDNETAASAWVIQLMALKNAENAEKLVKDLQNRGYQAHIKQESEFTRVIIGPDISKAKLEKQIEELQKITGSKGQLLRFNPLNP